MKAFEQKFPKPEKLKEGCCNCRHQWENRKQGWKEALEWILSQPDGSCKVRKCVPMEAIREELGYYEEEKRTTNREKSNSMPNPVKGLSLSLYPMNKEH